MLHFLPAPLRGLISILILVINTVFWSILLFLMTPVKLVVPFDYWRSGCNKVINAIAGCWIRVNGFSQWLTARTCWDVQGVEKLNPRQWYMVLANHQSWADIFVLQRIFHNKIPLLKFFLKRQLLYIPVIGQAWWALDFPFMQRYSARILKKKPHLIGKDLEITRIACEKFKSIPVSIMNFVEGTRFTPAKHRLQRSPYKNLLRTKAGGAAFVMSALGEKIHSILDVTIVYPRGGKSFWSYLCGNIKEVRVRVKAIPVSRRLMGDYLHDVHFKRRFQSWLNDLWEEKDACIEALMDCR